MEIINDQDWRTTICMLAGETTIYAGILMEDQELVNRCKAGRPYKELLKYCQHNW